MKTNKTILIIIFLILITSFAYWKVTSGKFLCLDDDIHIYRNNLVLSGKLSDIQVFWKQPFHGLYIPLTYTVWAAQAKVSNLFLTNKDSKNFVPRFFHTVNLLIHIFNVLLVFSILKKISKNDLASCCGALLFSLHPVQVESVAWISEMKGLLGGFFSLSAILLYTVYISIKKEDDNYKNRFIYFLLAIIPFLLALTSKPNTIVTPLVAGIIAVLIFNRSLKQTIKELSPWLLGTIPIMIYTSSSQPDYLIKFIPPIASRFLIAGDAISFYSYKLFFPLSLGADYGRIPQFVLSHSWAWITGLIPYVIFAFAGFISIKYHKKWLMAPLAIFVVGFLPVLGIKPFLFQNISTVADRYSYLSMLGPALAITFLFSWNKTILVRAVTGIILLGLLFLTIRQTSFWINSKAFVDRTKTINPESEMCHRCSIKKHRHVNVN